jgi:hypothetical protein
LHRAVPHTHAHAHARTHARTHTHIYVHHDVVSLESFSTYARFSRCFSRRHPCQTLTVAHSHAFRTASSDGWASPAEDDDVKWSENWAAGLSASDDDSDGDGHEWLKLQDPCTERELVRRRRKHLERLQELYELQYYRLQRVLERRYADYVDARSKAAAANGATAAGHKSRIPLNKRKLGETTAAMDEEDLGSTHQHRYNRPSGPVAALTLQRLRRIETGYSYPYAVASSGGPGGSRLRCTMQAASQPPCYNCSLPYSRFCRDHILNDPAQVCHQDPTPVHLPTHPPTLL